RTHTLGSPGSLKAVLRRRADCNPTQDTMQPTGTKGERVLTGLPTLDQLLGGGLPAHQTIIVSGDPGTGKTVLCSQIAFARARQGVPVVYATLTSESNDKLLSHMR